MNATRSPPQKNHAAASAVGDRQLLAQIEDLNVRLADMKMNIESLEKVPPSRSL
jgi:hypothetical protein